MSTESAQLESAPAPSSTALRPTARALAVAGGVALLAGPALFFAGLATSPVQLGEDKASYIDSLMRDPMLTQISALLLHYGNLLMGLGVLALPWLVRDRRGAIPAVIGAFLASLALLGNSGALFADWMHLELGRALGAADAAPVSAAVFAHPMMQLSFGMAPLIAVGLVLSAIGLVRAGVVGWWTIPAVIVGQLGLLFLPYSMPILPALGTLPMLAVLVVGGLRVLGRVRIARG
ncbi:hypothetical protein [Microbacterium candidum]|uniref:DUF4386 family protein n=1 Tax=Microbacterium candidum TaxID=3041922 RepID=A0ABT7MXA3_9MICO|nr:hypothetical protein [Microbacterium sp. ASV49]MDL9979064.1 hypothetical protein [Microbacterium sp. ASV49]